MSLRGRGHTCHPCGNMSLRGRGQRRDVHVSRAPHSLQASHMAGATLVAVPHLEGATPGRPHTLCQCHTLQVLHSSQMPHPGRCHTLCRGSTLCQFQSSKRDLTGTCRRQRHSQPASPPPPSGLGPRTGDTCPKVWRSRECVRPLTCPGVPPSVH
eukprot:352896-Chlamydomonas_euryale.AAC.1